MAKILFSRHVLAVRDVEASRRWYQEVLGFEVDMQPDGWCFLKRDRCYLMLGECPESLPAHDLGDHSYFAYVDVDGVDALHQAVQEAMPRAGGELLSQPEDKPWGMREFGVRTLDGHRILFGESID